MIGQAINMNRTPFEMRSATPEQGVHTEEVLKEYGYDAGAIALKRAAEKANSMVFASLQRMSGDPKNQQEGIEAYAALANGNQRLTRALTVVAIHLSTGTVVQRPEPGRFVQAAFETLETLAVIAETGQTDAARLAALRLARIRPVFSLVAPCHPGAALRDLVLVHRGQATRWA